MVVSNADADADVVMKGATGTCLSSIARVEWDPSGDIFSIALKSSI